MKTDFTPDPAARSYRAGVLLGKAAKYGLLLTALLFLAFACGASLPWWLIVAPLTIPLGLAFSVFALLGVLVVIGLAVQK